MVLVCRVSAWFLFHVCLVDILDLVIVLFHSGAFRVVNSTRICFGLCPFFLIVLFRSGVFEYIFFCNSVVFATRVRFG